LNCLSGESLRFALQVYQEVEMTVTIGYSGTTANIILSGNIDYSLQEQLRSANQKALSNKQVREICVDFTEVAFLDSSVIRALLTLQKESDAVGKSLVLLNCNHDMREVFEIGGFDRMFTFR
jgi:anti-anti-sigma factor